MQRILGRAVGGGGWSNLLTRIIAHLRVWKVGYLMVELRPLINYSLDSIRMVPEHVGYITQAHALDVAMVWGGRNEGSKGRIEKLFYILLSSSRMWGQLAAQWEDIGTFAFIRFESWFRRDLPFAAVSRKQAVWVLLSSFNLILGRRRSSKIETIIFYVWLSRHK